VIEFIQQYPFTAIGIVGFCAGVITWYRADKKFKENQRSQGMFDEVNSKAYDEENIQ